MSNQQTPPIQEPPFDIKKWAHELKRQDAHRAHDKLDAFFDKTNEVAIKTSELAMRMALLINGGAAIALLTFIGTVPKEQKKLLGDTLIWFASGVVAATCAIILAYFAHYFMAGIASSKSKIWDHPYATPTRKTEVCVILNRASHIVAALALLMSLILFVSGILSVRDALTHLG